MTTAVPTPPRTALRGVAVPGLVSALGAYLTGGWASPTAAHRGSGRGMNAVRQLRRSRPPNPVRTRASRARAAR
ncbi:MULTISPECIES: hypothetical protein [Nocardia]|uniref:Uncharacterized protein n=1 Tax=Nocardia implantans TaxID=3108168 RepID=A0ABU6B2F1_9NOCA|nr:MULTISPECIES: hypothetical protein [unclassified Nocardia]MBF6195688.1 hypothetical protein [Nocardia beijingensis]MEA3531226.1 hypothetical protein [Nocardia sp. CDC192]MEB3513564.1 hypothetical protein [Nocardia sp. CDC186]